jgi:hypothetical protein
MTKHNVCPPSLSHFIIYNSFQKFWGYCTLKLHIEIYYLKGTEGQTFLDWLSCFTGLWSQRELQNHGLQLAGKKGNIPGETSHSGSWDEELQEGSRI